VNPWEAVEVLVVLVGLKVADVPQKVAVQKVAVQKVVEIEGDLAALVVALVAHRLSSR